MGSRADLAVPLLLQAPPGQVPNVHDDLVGLVGSEGPGADADVALFKALADTARAEHNVEQLIVVDLPEGAAAAATGGGSAQQAVLCKSAVHASEPNRFLSPRHQLSFKVDHTTLVRVTLLQCRTAVGIHCSPPYRAPSLPSQKTSDARPYRPNNDVEALRAQLEKYISIYVQDKYATGIVEVYAVPLPRKAVEVPDSVMEEAKAMDAEEDPSRIAAASSTQAQEPKADSQAGSSESVAAAESGDESDEQAAPIEDDPVEAAETTEAVEQDTAPASTARQEPARTGNDTPTSTDAGNAARVEPDDNDEETQGETQLVIHIVANKYKLSNFWSGRWRATFTLPDPSATKLDAHANVQIHYFEEGNVQLHTRKAQQLSVDSSSSGDEVARAKSIVHAIQQFEDGYQKELFQHSTDLSEGAFRALRRQLPMTRQKVDWDKVCVCVGWIAHRESTLRGNAVLTSFHRFMTCRFSITSSAASFPSSRDGRATMIINKLKEPTVRSAHGSCWLTQREVKPGRTVCINQ